MAVSILPMLVTGVRTPIPVRGESLMQRMVREAGSLSQPGDVTRGSRKLQGILPDVKGIPTLTRPSISLPLGGLGGLGIPCAVVTVGPRAGTVSVTPATQGLPGCVGLPTPPQGREAGVAAPTSSQRERCAGA